MTAKMMALWPLPLIACILSAIVFLTAAHGEASFTKREVYVTASFIDKESLFIENLQPDEVRILENGSLRKIELMARDELPTAYGLLFDSTLLTSDQLGNQRYLSAKIPSAVAAQDMAFELIDKHLRNERIWAASYDQNFHLMAAPTNDGFKVKDAINRIRFERDPFGAYAYAGLSAAVEEMNKCFEKRRVVILFLDAMDQQSLGKIPQLQNLLSLSNVELITICFAARVSTGPGVPSAMNRGALLKLAQSTAGQAYFTSDTGGHFEDITRRVYNQIRTFYTFGFQSDAPSDAKTSLVIRCTRNGSKVRFRPFIPVLSIR
jgi:hypothetical protein